MPYVKNHYHEIQAELNKIGVSPSIHAFIDKHALHYHQNGSIDYDDAYQVCMKALYEHYRDQNHVDISNHFVRMWLSTALRSEIKHKGFYRTNRPHHPAAYNPLDRQLISTFRLAYARIRCAEIAQLLNAHDIELLRWSIEESTSDRNWVNEYANAMGVPYADVAKSARRIRRRIYQHFPRERA